MESAIRGADDSPERLTIKGQEAFRDAGEEARRGAILS